MQWRKNFTCSWFKRIKTLISCQNNKTIPTTWNSDKGSPKSNRWRKNKLHWRHICTYLKEIIENEEDPRFTKYRQEEYDGIKKEGGVIPLHEKVTKQFKFYWKQIYFR